MVLFMVSTSRLILGFRINTFESFLTTKQKQLNAIGTTRHAASLLDEWSTVLSRTFSGMSSDNKSATKYYTIGITGATGMVGNALRDELRRQKLVNGKPVRIVQLKRGPSAETKALADTDETTLIYNPTATSSRLIIDSEALKAIDAIVHLAGENVATGLGTLGFLGIRPWTEEKKAEIINSRVTTTSSLALALSQSPAPQTFLCASGVGAYGADFISDEREAVDEQTPIDRSTGFLADVSRQWESATKAADNGKNRVVNMRFGVVISTKGGALGKLYPIFFLGGGGIVGDGRQYFTFISARDIARAIIHTIQTPSLRGPVNFAAPVPCTNAEFTAALGANLKRPTILPFPSFAVSALFGEMGEEMLLGGVRAVPGKLLKSGFSFQHPTISDAIQSALEENI
jgi:uncharacterized protein